LERADARGLAVLGLRRSGLPAALLARRRLPLARVVGLDEGGAPDEAVAELKAAGVDVLTGADARLPDEADLLIKSPGVPNESAVVQQALARGVALWSEVEFATRYLPNPLIGITGTNGKTTTTELTGAIFRDAGLPVAIGGNIGYALAAMPGEIADTPSSCPSSRASSWSTSSAFTHRPWLCSSISPKTMWTGTAPTAATRTPSCACSSCSDLASWLCSTPMTPARWRRSRRGMSAGRAGGPGSPAVPARSRLRTDRRWQPV
jgi:hypothetical protein